MIRTPSYPNYTVPENEPNIFILYIFTVLTAVGCIKLLLNLHNAGISKEWPEYSATIIESSYEKVEGLEGGVAYRVIIIYRYIVGGCNMKKVIMIFVINLLINMKGNNC